MVVRKKYSKEFKLDAVSLVLDQGYGCTEAAKSLGIHQPFLAAGLESTKNRMVRHLEATES
ncbi:transposase IS911 [Legionella steelei]|uniref:Transposase IS911 n=1 Tax=Legionella steelei TaxID=947033 RepID=A0A0W0ZD02_9GAMM|nr:transposase IS911 [Legionella steelei]